MNRLIPLICALLSAFALPACSAKFHQALKENHFLYVAGASEIIGYYISPDSGILTETTRIATSGIIYSLVADPQGTFLFAGSISTQIVHVYRVNPLNGALTADSSLNAGAQIQSMTIDETGTRLFLSFNTANSAILSFGRTTTGLVIADTLSNVLNMTPIPGTPFTFSMTLLGAGIATHRLNDSTSVATLTQAITVATSSHAVDPSGNWELINSTSLGGINRYRINRETGAFSLTGFTTNNPGPILFDPSGNWLICRESIAVALVSRPFNSATGEVGTATATLPLSAVSGPLIFHPTEAWAYWLNAGNALNSAAFNSSTGEFTTLQSISIGGSSGSAKQIALVRARSEVR
ncbi:MAG: beta-propeller fold lactonase family protein [Bacteriovoracia bacterium]